MTTDTQQVAKTIYHQLGGGRFAAMTGATFMSDTNVLIVKFKGSRKANYMKVTLNVMDLYDVKLCKIWGMNIKEVASMENAYNDMLVPFFEKETGLYTSL